MSPDTQRTRRRISDTWTCPRCNRAPKESSHLCVNLPPPTQEAKHAADMRVWLDEARSLNRDMLEALKAACEIRHGSSQRTECR